MIYTYHTHTYTHHTYMIYTHYKHTYTHQTYMIYIHTSHTLHTYMIHTPPNDKRLSV